jgi:enamine deaminase RidA (YjgF/YER057c/UK114 family)
MKYYSTVWEDLTVEVSYSSFVADFPEYHAIMNLYGDIACDAAEQFRRIEVGVERLLQTLPQGLGVAFKRYFISDLSNQTQYIDVNQGYTAVSVVQQQPLSGAKLAVWLYIAPSDAITRSGNATVITHAGLRHLIHTGLCTEVGNSKAQTEHIFRSYAAMLAAEGCTLERNCLRTWVFVRDIDMHYAGMAKVRRELFADEGLTKDTHFIASTGIEGRQSSSPSIVSMDAYAVHGLLPEQIRYLHAPSHLNPTHEYGVTFERGTAIRYPDRRHVLISGTASIDNTGQIVHPYNVLKQAARMMENIGALLDEAGASFNNVAFLLLYLRDIADYVSVNNYFNTLYPSLPKLILLAPVCRPGWLIEAECMAVAG